jgi:hypothetical protein
MRVEPADKGFNLVMWVISAAVSGTLIYLVWIG